MKKSLLSKVLDRLTNYSVLETRIEYMQLALGRIESRQLSNRLPSTFSDREFKVFSQWGEDGLIQYLTAQVGIKNKTFIEFGVQDYTEASTRFLLQKDNWSGLIMDGSALNIEKVRHSTLYWRYNLKAEHAFITAENINDLITKSGVSGEIGLLSVDIDGNDYWVWKAIECVAAQIVIVEYNSIFGAHAKVTIPYSENFYRTDAHYSNLYFGASIAAFTELGREKGYALVGSNSAGNNLFFVRRDCLNGLQEVSPQDGYVASLFREARDSDGKLTFLSHDDALKLIGALDVYDLSKGRLAKLSEAI